MSVAYLLLIISLLPITAGFALLKLYGISRLTICIFIYLFLIGIWQVDVAILYFKGVLPEETVLLLFKFLRLGPTFVCLLVFYIIYSMVDKNKLRNLNRKREKIFLLIVNKVSLTVLAIWTMIVFLINLTPYGVAGLRIETTENLSFYFPIYGPLGIFYTVHVMIFACLILILNYSVRYISDIYLQKFIRICSIFSILIFVPALLNFNPNSGLMLSSVGIVLYTIIIFVAYIQMYNDMMNNYHKLLIRQQKLDSIGGLSSALIHEVKNSLTLIKGYTDLLLRHGELNKKQEELLGFVKLGGEQLDAFVKGYSTFMKNEQMTFTLSNINKLIEQIVSAAQLQFQEVEISYECRDKLIMGYVNDTALYQVIFNLVKNAVEASQLRKKPKVRLVLNINDGRIVIDVIDNGAGIEASDYDTIFQPFYSSKESTGIGLAFCKKIVIEHRGDIKVVKSTDEGTHIQLVLPQLEFNQSASK